MVNSVIANQNVLLFMHGKIAFRKKKQNHPLHHRDFKAQRIKKRENQGKVESSGKCNFLLLFFLIYSSEQRRISAKHSDLDRNIPHIKRKQSPRSVVRIQKIFRLEHQLAIRLERHLGPIEVLSSYQNQQSNCLS